MYNFNKNKKNIKKIVNNIEYINNFHDLCNFINNNKDNYYLLFSKINNSYVNN